jgi:hypothetical protein
MAHVVVRIDWPEGEDALPPSAQAHVSVDDVTLLDAAAVTVASTVAGDLSSDRPLVVELDAPEPDPHRTLTVRVHVRRNGSDDPQVQPGDLITTRSYPVLTQGSVDDVRVQLVKV